MPPYPFEGHQHPIMTNVMTALPPSGQSISLGLLIDFILQRTYHELTVLAELLPRKTDMERKIEIVQFASRTRHLFVRLLALVKWASSASKAIMNFLDKQSMLFIDTADFLARIARQTLSHARLPMFHIPAAVEILTTGSYSRLPSCIKDRIIPPDPITIQEKRSALQRLNQIIQHRLVTAELPVQFRNLKIEKGRVTILISHEFEVCLTLMGDDKNIPWRILSLDILVEDIEIGDGRALVHCLQVQYLIQILQNRLLEVPRPLHELYSCLHAFCQSLQLEVLHSQILRLCRERLRNYIKVDEYIPGKCLVISYWLELLNRSSQNEIGYKLTVQLDPSEKSESLLVMHIPSLLPKEAEFAESIMQSNHLSIERLVIHTIHLRAKQRLNDLKQTLENRVGNDMEFIVQGSPVVLIMPILNPCLRSEQLLITVDIHTGLLLAHIPQYECPLIADLQQCLNGNLSNLEDLIIEIRFWITKRRIEKTLQHLPVSVCEKLPLLYNFDNELNYLKHHKMFVQFHRYPMLILVIELSENKQCCWEISRNFYLLKIESCSNKDENKESDPIELSLPRNFFKLVNIIEFDSFICSHAFFTSIEVQDIYERLLGKRKSSFKGEIPNKRTKHPAYLLPDISSLVALIDERMPFSYLASELTKRKLYHQCIEVKAKGLCVSLNLLCFPIISSLSLSTQKILAKSVISAAFRMQCKTSRFWIFEICFSVSSLISFFSNKALTSPLYFIYDVTGQEGISKMIDNMINDWTMISYLFHLVLQISSYLQTDHQNFSQFVHIVHYNYKKIIIAYGLHLSFTVCITWHKDRKYCLSFGTNKFQHSLNYNPHSLMTFYLETVLNRTKNVIHLLQILNTTCNPLLSVSKLPSFVHFGGGTLSSVSALQIQRFPSPVYTFSVLPLSAFHLRIFFFGFYCIDIQLKMGGLISIKDGAYSVCDNTKIIEELLPTQGLKAFLSKYVDESTLLKYRWQSEDDNPPSPIINDVESSHFLCHSLKPSSPNARESLRFPAPLTPSSGSNPHTPSSPYASNITQSTQHQTYGSSPATSFQLASPPSLPSNLNPSPSPVPLHVHSPSFLPSPTTTSGQVGLSPANSFLVQTDTSPFSASQSATSPATSQWPSSPNIPRPSPLRIGQSPIMLQSPQGDKVISRYLPQKSWAGAIPTLLTHEAFDVMCSPAILPEDPCEQQASPLYRFLSCVFLKKHLQRIIQADKNMFTSLPTMELWITLFKVEALHCRVAFDTRHFQRLHLKLQSLPDQPECISEDDMKILEEFFSRRLMQLPVKANALQAFCQILASPVRIQRDFVNIMRLEMMSLSQALWSLRLCLTIPLNATHMLPMGSPAVILKTKLLFFVELSRIVVPGADPVVLHIPILHILATNQTTMVSERNHLTTLVNQILKKVCDYVIPQGECSVYPCVRELVCSLEMSPENINQHQITSAPFSSVSRTIASTTPVTSQQFTPNPAQMNYTYNLNNMPNPNLTTISNLNSVSVPQQNNLMPPIGRCLPGQQWLF